MRSVPSLIRAGAGPSLLAVLIFAGCGGGPSAPEVALRAGQYRLTFEIARTITIPEPLWGRHEITFRMRDPAASTGDLELVESRRIDLDGTVVRDYLVVDPERTDIAEDRWALSFLYREGGYSVAATLVDLGEGNLTISPGCVARREGGGSYLAAGCRLDRL